MGHYYVWGKLISIPNDLDEYISIEKEFEGFLQDCLRKFDENARYYAEPKELIFNIKSNAQFDLSDGIRFLSRKGVYDFDVEDYFAYSDSYAKMLDVVSQYYAYAENIAKNQAYVERLNIAQAEAEAKSSITGLSFGILSSSFTAHMVYAMQNESKIKKQTEEAQRRFDEATARIKSATGSKITKECEGVYRSYFVPNFRKLIISFWSECFAIYIKKVEPFYGFDVNEIANQGYNVAKSNQVLENTYAADKKELIISALKYCPYNLEIYRFAEKNGLFCEELKNLLLFLGLTFEYEEAKAPKKTSADEEIANEAIRMILENQIDIEDSHWRTRANSYLAASKKLAEKYPNNYVAHGLVAIHTIAANLKDRSGYFWFDVRASLDKMFSAYKKNDPNADLWSSITERFIEYADFFVEAADEYVLEQDEIFSRQNPDASLAASETNDWVVKSKYKSLVGTAVNPVYKIVKGFEQRGVSEDEWQFKFFKASLLKIVCEFLKPYDMCYGYPGKWVRIQVPLIERQEALRIYDELVAEGVERSEEFQIYKNKAYAHNSAFGDIPNTVWRGDITREGRAAQGKLTPDEQAEDNKKMGFGALVLAIIFSGAFIINAATDGLGLFGTIWFILGIICWIASVVFLKGWISHALDKTSEARQKKKDEIKSFFAKNKKKIIIIASAVIVVSILLAIFIPIISRSSKYDKAVEYYNNGKYSEAIELFVENPHHKDSLNYIRDCSKQIISTANKGDSLYFGFYEQDGKNNGLEPIRWTVVAEQGDELILWSDYVLDVQPFDTSYSNVWADSSLYAWLNDEFKNKAFDAIEQAKVDNIYIFDNSAIETYDYYYEEIGVVTAYAKQLAQNKDATYSKENNSIPYWTSSKSTYSYSSAGKAGFVNCIGSLWDLGTEVGDYLGVRPVIVINTAISNETTDPLAAKFEKALSYYNSKDYPKAIEAFLELSSHAESASYVAKAKEAYYNQGIDFAKAENYSKAKEVFTYLGQYEDADVMLQYVNILNSSSYSTITFGNYKSVPLEWSVAKKEDDRYLLVCKYAVDEKAHNIVKTATSWEGSDIREWLNSTFYNSVFSTDEKNMIVRSAISTSKANSGGVATSYVYDRVFLLSLEEVNSLYSYSSSRVINKLPSSGQSTSKSSWWLRSQGNADTNMAVVLTSGSISSTGDYVNLYHGVRPAFYLNVAALKNQFVYLKNKGNQSSTVDVSALQNYINQGNYSTFISKTKNLTYADLQNITFSETHKKGFYNYLVGRIQYDTYISDFCAEFSEDEKYFWLIADYKDAANIIALNSVFAQIEQYNYNDNNYMALFTAKINEITPLWDTEYIRNLLTSDAYIYYYMTGYWRWPSSYYRYIRFYHKTGYSNTWMEYNNLPFPDIEYSYWDIKDGEMILCDNNDTILGKAYKFTFVSANSVEVYCYQDGTTYTLERSN